MDVKNSPEKYARTVGVNNVDMGKILESMRLLKESGVDYEFRTTIIKEFHTADDMQKSPISFRVRLAISCKSTTTTMAALPTATPPSTKRTPKSISSTLRGRSARWNCAATNKTALFGE